MGVGVGGLYVCGGGGGVKAQHHPRLFTPVYFKATSETVKHQFDNLTFI